MVEFGLPEMANTQAQDLIRRKPENGLAWAVSAYMNAKQHQTPTALADVALAVKYAPDDTFVLRTAGQLIAWYDTRTDKSQFPANLQTSVQAMRIQLANRPAYTEAYDRATQTYKELTQATSTQPSAPGTPAAAPQPSPSYGATVDSGYADVV